MDYDPYLSYNQKSGLQALSADYFPLGIEYKILQYTGLKDKNGKEIYEGDILKNENDFGIHYTDVVYSEGMFHSRYEGDLSPMPLNVYNDYHEVVGNIYENPELLEK